MTADNLDFAKFRPETSIQRTLFEDRLSLQ